MEFDGVDILSAPDDFETAGRRRDMNVEVVGAITLVDALDIPVTEGDTTKPFAVEARAKNPETATDFMLRQWTRSKDWCEDANACGRHGACKRHSDFGCLNQGIPCIYTPTGFI